MTAWIGLKWGRGAYYSQPWGEEGIPIFIFDVVVAGADTFQLPLEVTGTYDFHVDWGDGSSSDITVWDHADTNHSYAGAGTYNVKITGTITGWTFNNLGDKTLIHTLKSWGPLRLGDTSGYFYGCINLKITATDILDLTGTTSLKNIFRSCGSLTTIPSISLWDTATITTLQQSFRSCDSMISLDMNSLDMSLVTNTLEAFRDMPALLNFNISAWTVGSLINANDMFTDTTLSTLNYDNLITSWSPQMQTIVSAFNGGNSTYTGGGAVEAARDAWIAKGWVITDSGPV